jgi:hypothetical protein
VGEFYFARDDDCNYGRDAQFCVVHAHDERHQTTVLAEMNGTDCYQQALRSTKGNISPEKGVISCKTGSEDRF